MKGKRGKRWFSLWMVLSLVATCTPVTAMADDGLSYMDGTGILESQAQVNAGADNVTWELGADGTLTIRGSGTVQKIESGDWTGDDVTAIIIEDGITGIGDYAFVEYRNLNKLCIPESVTNIAGNIFATCDGLKTAGPVGGGYNIEFAWTKEIPEKAFCNVPSLKEVFLPEGLASIGESAFHYCTSLTEIHIPDSVTNIGQSAFYSCSNLEKVRIPEGADHLGSRIFENCDKLKTAGPIGGGYDIELVWDERVSQALFGGSELTEVFIPDGITSIAPGAFADCESLCKIRIPEGLVSIGSNAFYNCRSLETIQIPDSVISIGKSAFSFCRSLSEIRLPNITVMEDNLFYNCSSLEELNIPEGVTQIGGQAFGNCGNISRLYIPNSVANIESGAFQKCDGLKTAGPAGGGYDIEFGWINELPAGAFSGCSGLTEVHIPQEVTKIGDAAFSGCSSLEEIQISENVSEIGDYAFRNCSSLTQVQIPQGVSGMKKGVFSGCSSLTEIYIPQGATSIGELYFSGCSSLTDVVIPESVTNIEYQAFSGCTSLVRITIPASVKNMGYSVFSGCDKLKTAGPAGGGYNIEFEWSWVPQNAFSNCASLSRVVLPENLASIGEGAFSGCSGLKTAGPAGGGYNIEYGWKKEIPHSAFSGSDELSEVVIAEGITMIQHYAFHNCRKLEKLVIPESVEVMGSYIFTGCSGLKTAGPAGGGYNIEYNWKNEIPGMAFYHHDNLREVTISENVSEIKKSTLKGCSSLTQINLPKKLEKIGASAFQDCSSLKDINIPQGVLDIGEYAFRGCSSLLSVNLPESVANVWYYAFADCTSLTDVSLSGKATKVRDYVFSGCGNLKDVICFAMIEPGVVSCFENCPNAVLQVEPGSSAEQYAKDHNIPYVHITTQNRVLKLRITDENGILLTHGYFVEWYYGNTQIGSGQTISVAEGMNELSYKIVLEEEAAFTYYQPKPQTVHVGDTQELTYTLLGLPSLTVSGRVTDREGNGLPGAAVVLSQMAGNTYIRAKETATDMDGYYSLEVLGLPSTLELGADGYYQRTLVVDAEQAEGNIDLGTEQLVSLPENKITLKMTLTKAVANGENTETISLLNGNGLEYSIYNDTKGRDISDFKVQYPYLILGDGEADGDDKVILSVSDSRHTMTAEPVEVILDGQKMGTADIGFVQNGSFTAFFDGSMQTVMMIFDSSGKFVSRKVISSSTVSSGELLQGEYQAVFMQKTELLTGISDFSRLSEYGLLENKDYVRRSVIVKDGVVIVLDDVKVPVLDESSLYYTDESRTWTAANKESAVIGDLVQIRVQYGMKPEYVSAGGQNVRIEIPDGVKLVENSVTADGKPVNYSYQNRMVTVYTNKENSIIRCYVIPEKEGLWDIHTELAFTYDGAKVVQPVGSVQFSGELMKLAVPDKTNRKVVTAIGSTMAGSKITVFDNGVKVGSTKTNAAGNWQLEFDLVRPFSYSYHDIYASVENDNFDYVLYTDIATTVYMEDYPEEVSKVTMYNRGDNGQNQTVFDFIYPGKKGSYRMWPGAYPEFTFVIEFTGNASSVENVVLDVFTKSGQVYSYDADYDSVKDVWIVTANFKTYQDAPVNVGVEYTCKEISDHTEYDVTVHPEAEAMNKEFLDVLSQRFDDLLNIKIDEDTEEKLTLSYSLAESGLEGWDMTMQKLDYADFDISQMESQGFIMCEADDPEDKPQYLKAYADENNIIFTVVDEEHETAYAFTVFADFSLPELETKSHLSASSGYMDGYDFLEALEKALGMLLDKGLAGSSELAASVNLRMMVRRLKEKHVYTMEQEVYLQKLMGQKCQDGSLGLPAAALAEADKRYQAICRQSAYIYGWMESELELYRRKIRNSLWLTMITLGFVKVIDNKLSKTKIVLNESAHGIWKTYDARSQKMMDQLDELTFSIFKEAGKQGDLEVFDTSGIQYWKDMNESYKQLDQLYDALQEFIAYNMTCNKDENPERITKKGPDTDKTPILDPSGYVCEAVPSNRLEGVKTTISYQEEKKGTDGILTGEKMEYEWNAQDFDQENPLLTGMDGSYHWDVPEGQWRVKYEKGGYQTAYSEWLPVPPPQTDVNAALVSEDAPEVKTVNAYKDNIKITFSQYMDINSVSNDCIEVMVDGRKVSGKVTAYKPEASFKDDFLHYAKTFVFIPEKEISGEAAVIIKNAVNYAGTAMQQACSVRRKVVEEPKLIEAEDYVEIAYNSKENIVFQVMPKEAAAGLAVTVKSYLPGIVSAETQSIQVGADGKAEMTLLGNLPGSGEIMLSIDGTDISKKITVRVGSVRTAGKKKETCEKVEASAVSGSTLPKGTKVVLSTGTDGAEIYYTLDGSCPCTIESSSRIKYTGPIEITKETFLIAYAVKDGYKDSPTAGFLYYIEEDAEQGYHTPGGGQVSSGSGSGSNDYGVSGPGMQNGGTSVNKPGNGEQDSDSPDNKEQDLDTSANNGQKDGGGESGEDKKVGTKNAALKKGSKFTAGILKYKVVQAASGKKEGQVQVIKAVGSKAKITIPAKVTIPGKKGTFRVVGIAANALKGNKKVAIVKIGGNVKKIGAKAFYGCSKLKQVVIGKQVQEIGSKAFYKCGKLKKITIKSSRLQRVGNYAISGIAKNAVIKVPVNMRKSYDKKFNKKTGRKAGMKVVK